MTCVKRDVLTVPYPAGNDGTGLTWITSLTSLSSDLAGAFIRAVDIRVPFISAANDLAS